MTAGPASATILATTDTDTADTPVANQVVDVKSSASDIPEPATAGTQTDDRETDDTALKTRDDKPVTAETASPSAPEPIRPDRVPADTTPEVTTPNDHQQPDDPANSVHTETNSPSGTATFVTGQAIAVDGGHTAGRDHGVTRLMGLS